MKLKQVIKIEQVKKQAKENETLYGRVIRGTGHLGWSHDFKDCNVSKSVSLTRYGCPMLEISTDEYTHILNIIKCDSYGPHPIDTVMAMHFKNFEAEEFEVNELTILDFIGAVEEAIQRGDWEPYKP